MQRKIVRRSPDFAELRERGIESQLKGGAREFAHAHPGQGSADKRTQCNQPRLPARLGMFARGGEYAIERAFAERQVVGIEIRLRDVPVGAVAAELGDDILE